MLIHLTIAATLALAAPTEGRQRVPATDIQEVVRTAMADRLAAQHSTAEVYVSGRIADQWLPQGALEIAAGEVAGRLPRSRVGVPVNLSVNGQVVRSLTAWVEMREPRTVLTYAVPYVRHHAGESMQWQLASVDMTCCPGEVATSAEQVSSMRITRAVREGNPVMLSDFETVPEVQAQQRITIEVVRGAVRLQTAGVALRDGRIGDRVAVQPDHSRQPLRSRVVSTQTVVVE